MLRVTITDRDEGISVAAPVGLGPALIAALGADPTSIETLLRAADAIYHEASRLIVGALIARDRAELRAQRTGDAPPPLRPATDTWAITSEETFDLAHIPAPDGLLWLDLELRAIHHRDLTWPIEASGEIRIFDGSAYVQRTVTYDVRGRWKIMTLI